MRFTGSYRLQLHDGFGLDDARQILDYVRLLGVSHVYVSPILQAASGSMHGYDVVDHTRISDSLGGRAAFEDFAARAAELDLGIIVDVVPNHMALVAPEDVNLPLWRVLRDGRDAETAHWFDIDWKSGGGRLGLPVLGDTLENVLDAGELVLDDAPDPLAQDSTIRVLRYFDHVFPTALGTEGGPETSVKDVLDRQHYRLTSWRDRDAALNYRRFFEVDELIAVRVELDDVFDETHALLLELNHAGLIDGFRIDHPDGLADPAAYLARLRDRTRKGTLIWVEKILEGSEDLPTAWECEGTTGYDAMRAISSALVDTADVELLTAEWESSGGEHTLAEAVDHAKRQVVAASLVPEVDRLTRRAREVLPDLEPDRLRAAVVELLVAGEVYRAYVRPDERLTPEARERLATAFAVARVTEPDLVPELDALLPLAIVTDEDNPAALDFAVRLQQTWGPVMAKGIEDTTYYRWHRLVALNEVGGDPDAVAHGGPQVLHDWCSRQAAEWPLGMTCLSTHDTKRSEDVRARILAVAADPTSWEECSRISRDRARDLGVDPQTAHLVWQTLLGVGEIDQERIHEYLLKALREAKLHTAWVDGDAAYEERVLAFVDRVRQHGPLHEAIERAACRNEQAIRATVLAQKALALTVPGMPDTYQGCEIVDLSLVDPDNRRPVDYARRRALLDEIDALESPEALAGPAAAALSLDAEKLLLTTRILRLRRDQPDIFGEGSTYTPLETGTDHLLGFVRSAGRGRIVEALGIGRTQSVITLVTRAPARLAATGGWGEATLTLPEADGWTDVLTGRTFLAGDQRVDHVLSIHPVAVLERR